MQNGDESSLKYKCMCWLALENSKQRKKCAIFLQIAFITETDDPNSLIIYTSSIWTPTRATKKKKNSYFPLYRLLNRDPNNGLLWSPHHWIVFNPLFYCSYGIPFRLPSYLRKLCNLSCYHGVCLPHLCTDIFYILGWDLDRKQVMPGKKTFHLEWVTHRIHGINSIFTYSK